MISSSQTFIEKANAIAFDTTHRKKLLFNIGQYNKKVVEGKTQYANYSLARERASFLKWKTTNNLEKYLVEFEANFIRRGGKVIWAQNAAEAVTEIIAVLEKAAVKSVVKSKSMTTEEIHLNHHLEQAGIDPVETDLGEYIVQLRNEPPYHIVTPAMHLSKEDVAKTFNEVFNLPIKSTPTEITAFV